MWKEGTFIPPAISRNDNFLKVCKKMMISCKNDERRHKIMISWLKINYPEDINYIFELRRELRKDSTTSISSSKLMQQLKNQDDWEYEKLKRHLSEKLRQCESGEFTKSEIIDKISKIIVLHISYDFIKLSSKLLI
jgi:hypothetical protein